MDLMTPIFLTVVSAFVIVIFFTDYAFAKNIRGFFSKPKQLADNQSLSSELNFYRKYRIQNYNTGGKSKDLLIPHSKLIVTEGLWPLEQKFLAIKFGEIGFVTIGDKEYQVIVTSQSVGCDVEEAIAHRQAYLKSIEIK